MDSTLYNEKNSIQYSPEHYEEKGFLRPYKRPKKQVTNKHKDEGSQDDGSDDSDYYSDLDQLEENKSEKKRCRHKVIKDYKCTSCDFTLHNFQSFFDTGNIMTYIRVLFLSDSDQIHSLLYPQSSQTANQYPKLIYTCYRPTNIIQMREYILYLIHKNLRGILKQNPQSYSYIKRLINLECNDMERERYTHKLKTYLKHYAEQKQKIVTSINTLFIDSLFESGNLECAYRVSASEQKYDLYMNVDSNTKGHQQWFYFRVRNIQPGVKYTFTLRNFTKGQSLYKKGMKVLWKSKKEQSQRVLEGLTSGSSQESEWCQGWEQIDEKYMSEVEYQRGNCERSQVIRGLYKEYFQEDGEQPKDNQQTTPKKITKGYYHSLRFTIEFPHYGDTVYFAYSRPYPYSQVMHDIMKLENELQSYSLEITDFADNVQSPAQGISVTTQHFIYQRNLLCQTIAGLPVPIITITGHQSEKKPLSKRQAIFVSARVHPGETNSSYVFDGLFKLLTNPNPYSQFFSIAQTLRENFILKLVPCLNPDGVSCGNYRTSLAGVDLNRQWICPHQQLHPTIYHIKQAMEQTQKEREILLYCDMHGHSKKKNSFIYGCNAAANGGFQSWTKVRLFPRILARNSYRFNINDCTFKVQKSKLGTARVVVWKEFSVTNSFTLENSFYGYDYGIDGEVKEFTVQDYRDLGVEIVRSIWEYRELCQQIQKELNLTKGWLKPKLLLQVTGIPAAERVKEEMKELNKRKIKNIIQQQQPVNQQARLMNQSSMKQSFAISHQSTLQESTPKLKQKRKMSFREAALFIQAYWRRYNYIHKRLRAIENETIQTVMPSQLMRSIGQESNEDTLETEGNDDSFFFEKQAYALNPKTLSNMKLVSKPNQNVFQQSPTQQQQQQHDWRSYFTIEELEIAYNKILSGIDPNNEEGKNSGLQKDNNQSDDGGSDSCPSDDNLNIKELYRVIYVRKKYQEKEIQSKIAAEEEYLKKFHKFLNKQIKQFKRKGSNVRSQEGEKKVQDTSLDSIDRLQDSNNKESVKRNMIDKFSKIKLIMRSRSKEQIIKTNQPIISRDEALKQIGKQNRSLNYDQQSSLTNESINNLHENMFLMNSGSLTKQSNPTQTLRSDQQTNQNKSLNLQQIQNMQPIIRKQYRLKSPVQKQQDESLQNLSSNRNQQSNVYENLKQNNQQITMQAFMQKDLTDLKNGSSQLNARRLKSQDNNRDYTDTSHKQPQNEGIQSVLNRSVIQQSSLIQQRTKLNSSALQKDRRLSSQDYIPHHQQMKYQNLVPEQTQSKTIFMQNQYPLLPLLNMEGTNVQKTNQMIEKHQEQERSIINKESQSIRDFMDISIEVQQRKQQHQLQRPQSNQFFNKRIKSKSPEMNYTTSGGGLNNNQQNISQGSIQTIQRPGYQDYQSNIINQPQTTFAKKNQQPVAAFQKQSFRLQNLIPSLNPNQVSQSVLKQGADSSFNGIQKQPIMQGQNQHLGLGIKGINVKSKDSIINQSINIGNTMNSTMSNYQPNEQKYLNIMQSAKNSNIRQRKINSQSPTFYSNKQDTNRSANTEAPPLTNQYQNQSQYQNNPSRQLQQSRISPRQENLGSDDEETYRQEINQICSEMMIMRQHQQPFKKNLMSGGGTSIQKNANNLMIKRAHNR